MPSARYDIRLALTPEADLDDLTPEIAAIFDVLPVVASIARSGVDRYVALRDRYAAEGHSRELADEALAIVNDLGTVLQGLRRNQVWVQALATIARPQVRVYAPPMFLLDVIHNNLLMLTVDDPDTMEVSVGPEELDRYVTAADVRAWFSAVDDWMARAEDEGSH